ncbi:MAG: hypothetical protein E6J45_11970 [Chloroflexi bacterium]|nr:MAG: hypothetical protein E6J45_11970 [Chloroflexota bacterium]
MSVALRGTHERSRANGTLALPACRGKARGDSEERCGGGESRELTESFPEQQEHRESYSRHAFDGYSSRLLT